MNIKSAPFAALSANVVSNLHSRSLSRAVDFWDETALDITAGRFPFSGVLLAEDEAESVRATVSIAIYDAIHAVLQDGVSIFYQEKSKAETAFGAEAAASQAAFEVLASYFTDLVNQSELKLRLARRLAYLTDSYEKTEGRETGHASARAALKASQLAAGELQAA